MGKELKGLAYTEVLVDFFKFSFSFYNFEKRCCSSQGCAMGWDNYGIGRGMVPSHEIGWDGTGFSKISSHALSHSYKCVHSPHFLSYVALIFYLQGVPN